MEKELKQACWCLQYSGSSERESSRLTLLRMTHKITQNCSMKASIRVCQMLEDAVIPDKTACPI